MFVTDLILKVPATDDHFLLAQSLCYEGARENFCVPAGFRTDLASVPRSLRWLIATYGAGVTRCAVLHDYLCRMCRRGLLSCRDADGIFRRCLEEEGVHPRQAELMWAAVRLGSDLEGATRADKLRIARVGLVAPFLLLPWVFVYPWQLAWDMLTARGRTRSAQKSQ